MPLPAAWQSSGRLMYCLEKRERIRDEQLADLDAGWAGDRGSDRGNLFSHSAQARKNNRKNPRTDRRTGATGIDPTGYAKSVGSGGKSKIVLDVHRGIMHFGVRGDPDSGLA